MQIRTVCFDPLKVAVNNVETPVYEASYLDEDGKSQTVSYIVVGDEKICIRNRVELELKLLTKNLDAALSEVEQGRQTKLSK